MALVVVADDDEAARLAVREALARDGHDVIEAVNGRQCLSYCLERRPDLAIVDIIMPDKEGIETIIDLRKAGLDGLSIIAISGGGRSRSIDFLTLAQEYGADRVLSKPFSRADLVAAVREVLDGGRP
ncbi:MAG: response regulator [Candidatus Zixiibacteriota bacterium]